jgi:hypothetical protein
MTDEIAATACPPHRWEITLVRLREGLHDHYECLRCSAEKDVLRGPATAWSRRGGPRQGKAAF